MKALLLILFLLYMQAYSTALGNGCALNQLNTSAESRNVFDIELNDQREKRLTEMKWMIGRDMPEVASIAEKSFYQPWLEQDFVDHRRRRDVIGMTADGTTGAVQGYMVYELEGIKLKILNLAVHPSARRQGVGESMVRKLIGKLSKGHRETLEISIPADNADGIEFFMVYGFRPTGEIEVLENGQQAILMKYETGPLHVPEKL